MFKLNRTAATAPTAAPSSPGSGHTCVSCPHPTPPCPRNSPWPKNDCPNRAADILAYHVRIQPHCVHAIALGPKMIAPVRLLLQKPKLVEQLHRCLPLQPAQQLGYRYLRRNHHNQVHVIWLHLQPHRPAARIPTDRLYPSLRRLLYRSGQNLKPILRYPYNMLLTMPQRV